MPKLFERRIIIPITKLLYQATKAPVGNIQLIVTVNGEPVKPIERFKYLGSPVLQDTVIKLMRKTAKRVWKKHELSIATKMKAVVLSSLLNALETV